MTKITNSIVNLIGNTPIVKLNRVVPEDAADVYVKLEFFNPGGSIKDRIALAMIEEAEKAGKLQAGGTIVEPTSGNTGVGLAMVAAAKGYHLVITMPETMSVERRKLMQGYGAELILTPGADGMKGAIAKAEELVKEKGYFMPMQFDNPANPAIHEKTTGKEILDAFGDDIPDAFVAGVGTGGTLTGVGHALKKANPNVQVYALEPAESPVLKEGKGGKHKIQGSVLALSRKFLIMMFMTESSKLRVMTQLRWHVKSVIKKEFLLVSQLVLISKVRLKLPKSLVRVSKLLLLLLMAVTVTFQQNYLITKN